MNDKTWIPGMAYHDCVCIGGFPKMDGVIKDECIRVESRIIRAFVAEAWDRMGKSTSPESFVNSVDKILNEYPKP